MWEIRAGSVRREIRLEGWGRRLKPRQQRHEVPLRGLHLRPYGTSVAVWFIMLGVESAQADFVPLLARFQPPAPPATVTNH